ncbi:MAG: hypothetical protein O9302_00375 [Cyclobacteriaceae bacterium]|jgi:hypothetical protein|nr:hypothetical protein [Cytophagales bacterium]MCZ8326486.1 hypothetical protein [Cyclobacteriaceae bacterium]
MLSLSKYSGYKQYWQTMATQHVDIQGFKYGNADVLINGQKTDKAEVFLHAIPYERARYKGVNVDQQYRNKRARFAVYKKSVSRNSFIEEEELLDFCEQVCSEIMGKIIYNDKKLMNVLIDVNSIDMRPVEDVIGATKYVGVHCEFDVMDNPSMEYNPAKFNIT